MVFLKNFSLLTIKPIIYLANVCEEDLIGDNKYVEMVKEYSLKENAKTIKICAKMEFQKKK